MPIKIPIYEAQREPGGFVQSPNAPVAQPPDQPGYIGASLQNLGNAGLNLAAVLRKEQIDEAISKKGAWLSESQVYWDQQLIDGFNATKTGKVKNKAGEEEFLATSISRSFNEWRDKALSGEPDLRVRRWLEGQLNTLGTHVNQRAIVLQERAIGSDRKLNTDVTIHNYEELLRTGRVGLEMARQMVLSVIANSGMSPLERNQLAITVEQRLSEAYAVGTAYRDPREFRGAVQGYLGSKESIRDYLDRTSTLFEQESGNVPQPNKLGSGAGGRGQWMPGTWAAAREAIHGLPEDPNKATEAQEREVNAWFASNNQRAMTRELGRLATPGELRFAHFFGAAGAIALMRQNPDTKFNDLPDDFWQRLGERFSNQTFIRQNPGVKNQTIGGLLAQYRRDFERGSPTPGVQTAAPGAIPRTNLEAAERELGLTPQEKYLYEHHLANLSRGGVKNRDGTISTVLSIGVQIDGREYVIPTVWDNKIVANPAEAIERAKAVGLDKFPSYANAQEAINRGAKIKRFMDRDEKPEGGPGYFDAKRKGAPAAPAASGDLLGMQVDITGGPSTGAAAAPFARSPMIAMNADMALMLRTLDSNRLTSFIQFAQNIENRDMARTRVDVETTLSNHRAMFMNGETVTAPLTYGDFDRAYGPLEAGAKWTSYQGMMALGADIQNMQNATPAQAMAILNNNRPVPNSPDYALQNEKYNSLASAWNAILEARNKDPVAYARDRLNAEDARRVKDINYSNQHDFVASVMARIPIAIANRDLYGVGGTSGNLILFDNREKLQAQAMFQRMSDLERVGYINALARATENNPEAYRSILQQLFPDRPVILMAGEISLRQRMVQTTRWPFADETITALDVAAIMLRGDSLLNPNATTRAENGTGKTFVMPRDVEIEKAALDYVGNAFRGRGEAFAQAMQGVRAFYAGWTDRKGTASPDVDSTSLRLAIRATIGNVDNHGKGAKFVLPWGMEVSAGRAAIDRAFAQAMEKDGLTGTPQANIRLYDIENYRPNQYVLRVGTDYMKDRSGQTIVLNISGAPGIDGPALPPPPSVGVVPGRPQQIQEVFNRLTPAERVAYGHIDMEKFGKVAPEGVAPLAVITVPQGRPYAGRAFIVPTMQGGEMIVKDSTDSADYEQQLFSYWIADLMPRNLTGTASKLKISPKFPLYNTVEEALTARSGLLQVLNDDLARLQASQKPKPQPPQLTPELLFPSGAPPERGGRVPLNKQGGGRQELRR